jgi:phosphoglucomutase
VRKVVVAEAVMLRETRVRKRVSGKVQKIGVYCNSYRTVNHRKKIE